MVGKQGHNKGGKDNKGQFKTVNPVIPTPPTPSVKTPPTPRPGSPEDLRNRFLADAEARYQADLAAKGKFREEARIASEKSKAEARLIDASWEPMPIEEVKVIGKAIGERIGWSNKNIIFDHELHSRLLTKAVLPALSVATLEQMQIVLDKVKGNGSYAHFPIIRLLNQEIAFRSGVDKGEAGVGELLSARKRLQEQLEQQNAPYTPEEIVRERLDRVQADLADPTVAEVVMKVPSGMEVYLGKPEARAILLSMGVEPATVKSYKPLWLVEA